MNGISPDKRVAIGEVYLMRFDGQYSEQNGLRPGLVFQNNIGNENSPNIIALPMTSAIKKLSQPTHVLIRAKKSGLWRDSIVLCENPECLSKAKIGDYITTLSHEEMRLVAIASILASSAVSFLDADTLLSVWRQASRLNNKRSGRRDLRV